MFAQLPSLPKRLLRHAFRSRVFEGFIYGKDCKFLGYDCVLLDGKQTLARLQASDKPNKFPLKRQSVV
jgi:hypothetical protein